MKHLTIVIAALILLASCTSEVQKKVLIMGKGDIVVAEKNVTMVKGSGYAEKELIFTDKEAIVLNVETEDGKKEFTIPAEIGYYILNLKKDTVAGSIQIFGKDVSNNAVITQEDLKLKIDSLVQMVAGKNINSKTNFMVLPGQPGKISNNINAKVFGPFRKIPATLEVAEDSKEPEIYKFYTNAELVDLIAKLKKLTI